MIDLLVHVDPTWTDEAREQFFHDLTYIVSQIPNPYPVLQVHTVPNGDFRIRIGEGFADLAIEGEAIIINATQQYL